MRLRDGRRWTPCSRWRLPCPRRAARRAHGAASRRGAALPGARRGSRRIAACRRALELGLRRPRAPRASSSRWPRAWPRSALGRSGRGPPRAPSRAGPPTARRASPARRGAAPRPRPRRGSGAGAARGDAAAPARRARGATSPWPWSPSAGPRTRWPRSSRRCGWIRFLDGRPGGARGLRRGPRGRRWPPPSPASLADRGPQPLEPVADAPQLLADRRQPLALGAHEARVGPDRLLDLLRAALQLVVELRR